MYTACNSIFERVHENGSPHRNNTYSKMNCDCCDQCIQYERDSYEYEPLGIVVCERCIEILTSGPDDDEMEDLSEMMEETTLQGGK